MSKTSTIIQRILAPVPYAIVGGYTRDMLLGIPSADIDIAIQCPPTHTIHLLQKAGIGYNTKGAAFGSITADIMGKIVDITSLRTEVYKKPRFPRIRFTQCWKKDALRRDFTINALYLINGKIYDPTGLGLCDIKTRTLRFIGDPVARLKEDPSRLQRYHRLLQQKGLTPGHVDLLKNTPSAII